MPQPLNLGPAGTPGTEIHTEQDGSVIRRSVLPGGIRVLTEAMPGQRSTAVGAWVAVGSRDETDGHFGSTHFLEHLLFKGTTSRSALDIAEAFDAVGGEANAATGKEHTCYYARVLDADLPMAVDVIADMVTSSVIDAGELETERGVILEELAMNDDDPVDVAHERFTSVVLGDHPLGRPIGGTPETIRAVPRDAVVEHYRRTYVPHELVVTAAGSVDHDALCAQVLDAVRSAGWALDPQAVPAARRTGAAEMRGVVPGSGAVVLPGPQSVPLPGEGRGVTVRRPTEQANVLLGGPRHRRRRRAPLRALGAHHRARRGDELAAVPGDPREAGPGLLHLRLRLLLRGGGHVRPVRRLRAGRTSPRWSSCWPSSGTGSCATAWARTSCAAASASCAATSCSGWRTTARACPGSAGPRSSTAS